MSKVTRRSEGVGLAWRAGEGVRMQFVQHVVERPPLDGLSYCLALHV